MNIEQIKDLVQLMVEHDLTRVELREGDTHVLLRRGHAPVMLATPPAATTPTAPPPAPPTPATPPVAPAEPAAAPANNEHLVRSPMVGTFYAASGPDSPPFVGIGDEIEPDTVVCVVEAMKVFNEIKAGTSGRIAKVLAKSGQAVEFDQPLFAVARE